MSQWVRSKLLLRQGRIDEALAQLQAAVRQLPPVEEARIHRELREDEGWELADGPLCENVRGELGMLLLARRQFVQALGTLLEGGYWEDAAYVAERVLTADELKAYVDAQWSAPEPEPEVSDASLIYRRQSPDWLRMSLRYLLARRLTRLGRWMEARQYYPAAWRPRLDVYIIAIRQGHDRKSTSKQRAESLWQAARIARHEGMELLGYELGPDCFVYRGSFPDPEPMLEQRLKDRGDAPLTAL